MIAFVDGAAEECDGAGDVAWQGVGAEVQERGELVHGVDVGAVGDGGLVVGDLVGAWLVGGAGGDGHDDGGGDGDGGGGVGARQGRGTKSVEGGDDNTLVAVVVLGF